MIFALLAFLLCGPAHAANFQSAGGLPAGLTFDGKTLGTPGYLIVSTINANQGSPIFERSSDGGVGQNGFGYFIRSGNMTDESGTGNAKDAGPIVLETGKPIAYVNDNYSGDVVLKTGDSSTSTIKSGVGTVIIRSGQAVGTANTGNSGRDGAIVSHVGILIQAGFNHQSGTGASVDIWGSSGTGRGGDVNVHGGTTNNVYSGAYTGGNLNFYAGLGVDAGHNGAIYFFGATNVNGLLSTNGDVSVAGTLTAAHLAGEGSAITGIVASVGAAGNNTDVQYNASGSLAGSDNLTFDGTTLNAVNFTAGNIASINTVPYSWTATQGNTADYLANDGAGNLSWTPITNGSTGNQVLYNSSNLVAGSANLTFDGTTLGVYTIQISSNANVGYTQVQNSHSAVSLSSATCPGTQVQTGGGCQCSSASTFQKNFPLSSQTWSCQTSALCAGTLTAYVNCARLGPL